MYFLTHVESQSMACPRFQLHDVDERCYDVPQSSVGARHQALESILHKAHLKKEAYTNLITAFRHESENSLARHPSLAGLTPRESKAIIPVAQGRTNAKVSHKSTSSVFRETQCQTTDGRNHARPSNHGFQCLHRLIPLSA